MQQGPDLTADLPVADVMRRWPETVKVFVEYRMACPGCPMAAFMSVADAAGSYGLRTDELLVALREGGAGQAS